MVTRGLHGGGTGIPFPDVRPQSVTGREGAQEIGVTADSVNRYRRGPRKHVYNIAGRDPWSFPRFNARDPEGEDVRSASVGQVTAVYWINRPAGRLYVIDIVWLG
ncbi:hypothetical protein [Streptomyces sp. NBC_01614]|uniref:Uncharacterized protein n=1 Tax=Streptomyces sp. NBC_00180 TaxID=2903632 RepID=A0AAU1HMJ0_9ACTN